MDKNIVDLLVALVIVFISALLVIFVIALLNKQADDNKDAIQAQRQVIASSTNNTLSLNLDVIDFTIPIVVLSFICIILFSSMGFFLYRAVKLYSSSPTSSFLSSRSNNNNTDSITTLTLTDSYENMF